MPDPSIQHITVNVSNANMRREMLEGKEYLVVPMVMITEGVHEGSDGPAYYPKAELSKTPLAWNHKPVIVYHPVVNGQGISACEDPAILERHKVGLIFNTNFDGTRLKAEAWLDPDRMELIDKRVLPTINAGKMMEVSTGLFTDNEETRGEFGGRPFNFIARNYRPDHLAILPDQIGACSIADGAGLLRNSREKTMNKNVDKLIEGKSTPFKEEDREWLSSLTDEQLEKMVSMPLPSADDLKPEPKAEDKKAEDKSESKPETKAEDKSEPEKSETKKADEPELELQHNKAAPQTVDQYVTNAPPEIRDLLEDGLRAHRITRDKLIETITANSRNRFEKKDLERKPLGELEAIATLATTDEDKQERRSPMFLGAAGGIVSNSKENEVEPLDVPSYGW